MHERMKRTRKRNYRANPKSPITCSYVNLTPLSLLSACVSAAARQVLLRSLDATMRDTIRQ
jgi:hypothetical protein